MTDILPHARTEVVPGQPMSPAWFNALRLAFRSLQERADAIAAQQAQLESVLASLQDANGNLLDVADAIDGKQDSSPALESLANLPGTGSVRRDVGGTWTASDAPMLARISLRC